MKRELKEELAAYFEAPKPKRKRDFVRQFGLQEINLLRLTGMQAGYLSKWVWILSALLCGINYFIAEIAELKYVSLIFAFIPFLVMLSVTESMRSYRYGMEELELATRFSLKSIVMARMVMLGFSNLAVLACLMFGLGGRAQINVVYIMTPYFLTAGGGLYIARNLRGNESTFLCFVLAALVCMLELYLPWQFEVIFTPEYVWAWVLVCIAGIIVTVHESYRMIRMTEDLAWN